MELLEPFLMALTPNLKYPILLLRWLNLLILLRKSRLAHQLHLFLELLVLLDQLLHQQGSQILLRSFCVQAVPLGFHSFCSQGGDLDLHLL